MAGGLCVRDAPGVATWALIVMVGVSPPGVVQPVAAADAPAPGDRTRTFAIMRNGQQIGTSTLSFQRDGTETTVDVTTHVTVRIASLIVYRFDQTESERWANGRLLAMSVTIDDNGALHRTTAMGSQGKITVKGDNGVNEIAPTVLPLNLWNTALLNESVALDPRNGTLVPVSVVDRGWDNLTVEGSPMRAHHYVITATSAQDAWYDSNRDLIQMEMKGRDGSTIRYRLL
jgi:hypothetical protein